MVDRKRPPIVVFINPLMVGLAGFYRVTQSPSFELYRTVDIVQLLGFGAFFRFTAEHPALYRIIRQAEFVSPETLVIHYERLTEGYVAGLRQAMEAGEIVESDPEVLAWSLMGIGELVGMRWILWNGEHEMPKAIFDELARIIVRAIGAKGIDP